MQSTLVSVLALTGACLAHGDHGEHSQKPIVAEDASWMTKHMAGKFYQARLSVPSLLFLPKRSNRLLAIDLRFSPLGQQKDCIRTTIESLIFMLY